MIARITGTLVEKAPTRVVVDVGGVGYEAHVSLSTAAALPRTGEPITLLTEQVVREDDISLYGFLWAAERLWFNRLRGVSGVGPTKALTILSNVPVPELEAAILGRDIARLSLAKGIGKKTAERLIVELGDAKAAIEAMPLGATGGASSAWTEAASALQSLGYSATEAQLALRKIAAPDSEEPAETLVRRALRGK